VKKAYASGDAVMSSPDATLVTDIINFDRNIQEALRYTWYNYQKTILKSNSGRYYVKQKKFQFLTAVTITILRM
jgi:hypothetical protein